MPHQRGQQIGREHVDGKDAAQAVHCIDVRFTVTDTDVVDDRIVAAQFVGLRCDAAHLLYAGEVADDDRLGLRQGAFRVGGAGVVAGVQGYLVPVLGQELPCEQAEAVG